MLETFFRPQASLENPNVPLSSPAVWDYLVGGPSSAGVTVSRDTVLGCPPVWRAVRLLSSDVAKLPLFVYRRLERGKERDTEHPAYRVLQREPNEYMTPFVFIQAVTAQALLHGNGYAYIVRDEGGDPVELLVLDAQFTYARRENGRTYYVTQVSGRDFNVLPENMLHIKGLSDPRMENLEGISVINLLRETLGLDLAMQKYASTFYKNNARPNMTIEMPGFLRDREAVERFRASFQGMHGGPENAGRVALLEGGAKLNPFSVSHEDAQFLGSRDFSVRQIANIFGVPPHKLGDPTRTAYASLEHENQSYLDSGLDPWLVAWEQECRVKLLREEEKDDDTHTIEFVRQAIVRADLATRYAAYAVGITNRILTPNEVREKENMNPYDGGDEVLVPLNMGAPADESQPVEPEPDDAPDEESEATRALVAVKTEFLRSTIEGCAAETQGCITDFVQDQLGVLWDRTAHVLLCMEDRLDRHGEATTQALKLLGGEVARTRQMLDTHASEAQERWDATAADMRTSLEILDARQRATALSTSSVVTTTSEVVATALGEIRTGVDAIANRVGALEDGQQVELVEANLKRLVADLTRFSKRIANLARTATKKPNEFHKWLDGLRRDTFAGDDAFLETVEPTVEALGIASRQPCRPAELANAFFDAWRGELLAAGDGPREQFADRVDAACDRLIQRLPTDLSSRWQAILREEPCEPNS